MWQVLCDKTCGTSWSDGETDVFHGSILQGCDFFSKEGFPRTPFPNGWKGKSGLYAAGFTRRGLAGLSFDAVRIAKDISMMWKEETKPARRLTACHRRCISQF